MCNADSNSCTCEPSSKFVCLEIRNALNSFEQPVEVRTLPLGCIKIAPDQSVFLSCLSGDHPSHFLFDGQPFTGISLVRYADTDCSGPISKDSVGNMQTNFTQDRSTNCNNNNGVRTCETVNTMCTSSATAVGQSPSPDAKTLGKEGTSPSSEESDEMEFEFDELSGGFIVKLSTMVVVVMVMLVAAIEY